MLIDNINTPNFLNTRALINLREEQSKITVLIKEIYWSGRKENAP
jgi:hypothetical protein